MGKTFFFRDLFSAVHGNLRELKFIDMYEKEYEFNQPVIITLRSKAGEDTVRFFKIMPIVGFKAIIQSNQAC